MPSADDMIPKPASIAPRVGRIDRDVRAGPHVMGRSWLADASARLHAMVGVSSDLSRLRDVVEEALADTFRTYVGTVIKAVSPLVLDACRMEGLELDTLLEGLRHDCPFRPWLGGSPPMHGIGHGARRFVVLPTHHAMVAQFHRCGIVVREEVAPMGALGFPVGARCLEFAMKTQHARMSSANGLVRLQLARSIPETLCISLRGRPIEDVVDHPVLFGRGYTVMRVVPSPHGGVCVLLRVGCVPWRMPWVAEASR